MAYHSNSTGYSPEALSDSSSSFRSGLNTPLTEQSSPLNLSTANVSPLDSKFIVVVGGLGYIGSHTCLELMKAGFNIIIIDDLSNSFRSVYDRVEILINRHCKARCQPMPIMRLYEIDYRDGVTLRQILEEYTELSLGLDQNNQDKQPASRITGVIHFAAFKSVSESIEQPLKYYANNVAGLIEFCSILNSFNIKTLVFSSSATVYGSLANCGKPLLEEYCTHQPEAFIDHEGAPKMTYGGCSGLTNPYGRTKWMCEAILSDLAVADPAWTIIALRYFNPVGCDSSGLLGEDPRGVPTNLMPIIVRVMTGQSSELNVFGTDWPTPDGTAIRDFIHVTDVARGHIAAVTAASDGRVSTGFRTYNLGSGLGHSVMEVVEAMEVASSTKIPIRHVKRREGDVGTCVAMPGRAGIELGWKTEKSLMICCQDICNFLDLATSHHALVGR